jgi:peptide/nickel transport system permease protein
MLWRITRHLLSMAATLLFGALFCAMLVRYAPGFATDEEQLDPRLNAESQLALRQSHASEKDTLRFYAHYLRNALHGDLGVSHSLGQPVRLLLRDRIPVTARLIVLGLGLGWAIALGLALTSVVLRVTAYNILAIGLSGAFLCIPTAALALLSVLLNTPGYLAIALVVFPKMFTYSRNLLLKSYSLPHIVTARAKGLGEVRILFWHVLPVSGSSLLALAGVSVGLALGAAIPVEALCGMGGVGALAWQAALGRDLPLLVTITILVTFVTLLANSAVDVIAYGLRFQEL